MEQSIVLNRKLTKTGISSIDECLMEDQLIICKTYNSIFLRKLFADYSDDGLSMPLFVTGKKIFDRERNAYERLSSSPDYYCYFPKYYGHFTDSKKNIVLVIERACGSLMQIDSITKSYHFTCPVFEQRSNDPQFLYKTIQKLIENLHRMHHHRLAHLDIKLDNFLNFNQEVKLADFNSSREFKRGEKVKGAYGSYRFAAPETLDGEFDGYDPFKADVWALGVCIFTLLAKKLPFQRETDSTENFQSNYENRIINENIDFEQVPEQYIGLLKQMLNRNWRERTECTELLSLFQSN